MRFILEVVQHRWRAHRAKQSGLMKMKGGGGGRNS